MELIIVESPTKARTIQGFLGDDYKVLSSMGHLVDLPRNTLSINVAKDFTPEYVVLNKKLASELVKASGKAKSIFLATDPDREGEAIAYHLKNIIHKPVKRALFFEITEKAVREALKNSGEIDDAKVEAQQARRILDRLVGYEVSPILWQIFHRNVLSAGRVQTVALRLICEKEEAIRKFKPEEFWTVKCFFDKDKKFFATLEDTEIHNKDEAEKVESELKSSPFIVEKFATEERQNKPLPPYITSTLQGDASTRLGFTTKTTMRTAQQLFEGIELKKGRTGLITYMRTDSLRVAEHAIVDARKYIGSEFGKDYLPSKFKVYAAKKSGAHEAIRPTGVGLSPESIKDSLTVQQYKLYNLIWQRFVASQMTNAIYEHSSIDISAGKYKLYTESDKLKFDGFIKVWPAKIKKEIPLPELKKGSTLTLEELIKEQKFTNPPSRYTEGTMVKELESKGIGRPSTYEPIISKILDKRYVCKQKAELVPTELGETLNKILISRFPDIFNIEFTSGLELKLDKIEEKEIDRLSVLKEFYTPFKKLVDNFNANKKEVKKEISQLLDEKCTLCGKQMMMRWGKFGKFIACSGFPECKNARPILSKTGTKCIKCDGDIIERRSKKGRIFYGCSNYPKCDFVLFYKPVNQKCEKCGYPLLVEKRRKIICPECNTEFNETPDNI
ncbi:MAG: type I DNA topoisomerase [bacterium]|nr:type I DNA topoisomerase [bacterium]